ncbi:MAG TPA: ABC transporter ATP-binding protein [Vicinamibacteria bacterium]|nr:ABC transporter ATP-binding protein [Vicinamibacteria bacterium]
MTAIIHLDRVSKEYIEGGKSRPVLREASAAFKEGEFVAIRGRSGSGKSTLLNLLAGIDLPTSGDVLIDGTCLNRLAPRDRTLFRRDHLGFVFQFFNLIPTLTVLENVQLPAELAGVPPREAVRRGLALLEEVGLAERGHDFPDRLSGGEQQRVAIARAIVQNPRLVLADEPTGNLDDATGQVVLDLLDRVTRRAGKTLILATHSPQVAARADRAFAIEDGLLVPLSPG